MRQLGWMMVAAGMLAAVSAAAETRKFYVYTVEVQGVKMWVPSTLVVQKGDTVEIDATSKIPGPNSVHGFTIEAFKVIETADDHGKKITFTADRAGIFPFRCHLHPAHVGGQLVVLK